MQTGVPRFKAGGEVYFGSGSVRSLARISGVKALVFCTPSIFDRDDLMKKLRSSIGAFSVQYECLPRGEPSVSELLPFVKTCGEFRPDWIIAVGGGSAIDSAKLVWVMYEFPWIDLESSISTRALRNLGRKARLAAIPTTVGSGSEVSSALVYGLADKTKKFIVSERLLPSVVVLDPEFVVGLPSKMIFQSAFDALSHSIEGYVSKLTNPFVDIYAETSIQRILNSLEERRGRFREMDNLQELLFAATMSGWVQDHKVPGIGHAFAHQLGGYGIPHAAACALMLPISVRVNSSEELTKKRYESLSQKAKGESVHEFLERLIDLATFGGISPSVSDFDSRMASLIQEDSSSVIAGVKSDICYRMNPVNHEDIVLTEILREALG